MLNAVLLLALAAAPLVDAIKSGDRAAAVALISQRADVNAPDTLVTGVGEGGLVLGTVLFHTDAATLRPEYAALLDAIAAVLERTQGGMVTIVGHTDVRGSHAYNTALGLRRAQAVYTALMQRLPESLRDKVRVEANENPSVPVSYPDRELVRSVANHAFISAG